MVIPDVKIKNPVNRFAADQHQYNRSAWLAAADNIDSSVTVGWRAYVDDLVHR